MTTSAEAWKAVADRFSALGLKLKMHLQEELAEVDEEDTWDRVRESFEEVFEALGDAAKDPAVRSDVKEIAQAMADAANATVSDLRARLSKA
jgi:hypothetical protein